MSISCISLPNILFTSEKALELSKVKDSAIKDKVGDIYEACKTLNTPNNLSNPIKFASEMSKSGILAFGAKSGKQVSDNLLVQNNLPKAIESSMFASPGVIIPAVASVIVILLKMFSSLMAKEKMTIGLILNNTDNNVNVTNWNLGYEDYNSKSDLFMNHGKMVYFMEDECGSSKTQIMKRTDTGGVYGGIYMMSKLAGALVGVESTMKLTIGSDTIDLLSCCPYTQDNRINLKLNSSKKPKSIHDELYNDKQINVTVKNDRISATSKIHAYSGSPSYVITYLNQL